MRGVKKEGAQLLLSPRGEGREVEGQPPRSIDAHFLEESQIEMPANDRMAIVTGAGSGIGRAIALALAAGGSP